MEIQNNDILIKLNELSNINISEVNAEDIADISCIEIKRNKSSNERVLEFLRNVDNPYILKVNNTLVKFVFSKKNVHAKDCISKVIKELYK